MTDEFLQHEEEQFKQLRTSGSYISQNQSSNSDSVMNTDEVNQRSISVNHENHQTPINVKYSSLNPLNFQEMDNISMQYQTVSNISSVNEIINLNNTSHHLQGNSDSSEFHSTQNACPSSSQHQETNCINDVSTNLPNFQYKNDSRKRESSSIIQKAGKRPATSTTQSTSFTLPLQNKYGPLANLQDSSEDPVSLKIPPIIVSEVHNFNNFLMDIQQIAHSDFATKSFKNSVKIMFQSIEDFRSYKKFCDSNNIQYYSYKDPTIKTFSVLIKDIPISYSNESIFNELTKLNFPVQKVYRLYNKNRDPIEICSIELLKTSDSSKIFKLEKLFHSVIKVQSKISTNSPVQCKRCQRYNHTQANCRLSPRCIRCPENHHYSLCNRPKTTPPICVNCLGPHTANYRGCKVYKELLTSNNAKFTKFSQQQNRTINNAPNLNFHNFPNLNEGNNNYSNISSQNQSSHENPFQQQSSNNNTTTTNNKISYSNILKQNTQNINFSTLISTIIQQILSSIIPQIQSLLQNLLPSLIHGKFYP